MAIDWEGVKKDFETARLSAAQIAEKHGCSQSALRKKAKIEGWAKQAAARKDNEAGAARPLQANGPEDVLDDHRSLWKGVKKRLVKGLQNDDVKLGLEELKVAKMAGEVLSNVIRGERLAWGIEDAAGGGDDAEEIAGQMEAATVSKGADEALDGE